MKSFRPVMILKIMIKTGLSYGEVQRKLRSYEATLAYADKVIAKGERLKGKAPHDTKGEQ